MSRIYANMSTAEVGEYFAQAKARLNDGAKNTKDVFDSLEHDQSAKTPETLSKVYAKMGENHQQDVFDSVMYGMESYEKMHGCQAPADLIAQALHNAEISQTDIKSLNIRFDSANETHMDVYSLQPNRAIVSVLSAFAEAIPFAGYVPADIGSNEARSLMLKNRTSKDWGGYSVGSSIDGTASGNPYILPNRLLELSTTNQINYTGTARAKYVANSRTVMDATSPNLILMAGRTVIMVNGFPCAFDQRAGGITGVTSVSGMAIVGGNSHAVSGTVNNDTGAIAIVFSPALPANTPVIAEVFVDFERDVTVIPVLGFETESYSYFAAPSQVESHVTMNTQTQVRNEMNLDPASNTLYALRTQKTNEDHYHALQLGMMVAANNVETYDFNHAAQSAAKTNAEIFQDIESALFALDQQMINDTLDHGITHLYVEQVMAGLISALPNTLFERSGLPKRAGIYRMGRLFGKYDVYCTPKIVSGNKALGTATVLCVGRSNDVGRNPIIMGDAVGGIFIPLATTSGLTMKQAYYQRSFLNLNKHMASAKGFARLDLINLPLL